MKLASQLVDRLECTQERPTPHERDILRVELDRAEKYAERIRNLLWKPEK